MEFYKTIAIYLIINNMIQMHIEFKTHLKMTLVM